MYNLSVDTLHTFFVIVGGLDMLVHNTDPACPVHGPTNLSGLLDKSPSPCTCPGGRGDIVNDGTDIIGGTLERRERFSNAVDTVESAQDVGDNFIPGDTVLDPLLSVSLTVGALGHTGRLVVKTLGKRRPR